jgi:uncharacterized membrane protein YsdA (DUF1294 family)
MMENLTGYIAAYFIGVSLWAAGLTIYDKRAARKGLWRVKERTLLLVAAIGGSVAMIATMRLIRHKTQHAKFTVGISVIIALQLAVAVFVWWRWSGGSI